MATAYNMVIGTSLVVLLALLVGMCLAGVWRHLTRQLTRSGLVVFLIGAGIATVEAQKVAGTVYVDQDGSHHKECDGPTFTDLNEAINAIPSLQYLPCTVIVYPGVYGPVLIDGDKFRTDILTWSVDVFSVEGAGKTIIDGGGADFGFGFTYDWPIPHPWVSLTGFTIRNADVGVYDVHWGGDCVIRDCRIGAYDAVLDQCVIFNNSEYGVYLTDFEKEYPDFPWEYSFTSWAAANCTIVSNGVGLCNVKQGAGNSIFWGNGSDVVNCGVLQSCFIGVDPKFVDEANGDLHLSMGSPCINLGDDQWCWLDIFKTDLDGNPRIQRHRIDYGAYEFQPTNEHQTITAPVPVEFAWVDEKCPKLLAECGGDYDKAVLMKSANPVDISLPEPLRTYYSIWESYVADLDPTASNQTFRATIEMVGGEPVVKGDPESPSRKYTVLGKEKLSDEKWQENLPEAQFFKVKVGLK